MRDWKDTLDWYDENRTAGKIGFDPDGMCLKVCRTARAIGSLYPSAKAAQDATPRNHRVYKVEDLRAGMVLYFDDPNDSNKWGHIVTLRGRVKGADRSKLSDLLVETNSVKANEVVVVRGDYFQRYWGDQFQFGATWLNGVTLDFPSLETRVTRFRKSRPTYDVKFLDRAIKAGRKDLAQYRDALDAAIEALPTDKKKVSRVNAVKKAYSRTRIIHMRTLNAAVNKGDRTGKVKKQRDKIRQVVKSMPVR